MCVLRFKLARLDNELVEHEVVYEIGKRLFCRSIPS